MNSNLEFSAMAKKEVIKQLLTEATNRSSGNQIPAKPLGIQEEQLLQFVVLVKGNLRYLFYLDSIQDRLQYQPSLIICLFDF